MSESSIGVPWEALSPYDQLWHLHFTRTVRDESGKVVGTATEEQRAEYLEMMREIRESATTNS